MPAHSDVLAGARRVLEENWREGRTKEGLAFGYTCPDATKYPDQFFWDSCFHALAWSRFDITRAMRELRSLGAAQLSSGFIGHTLFWNGPVRLARAFTYNLIHRRDFQTATIQPPLLGWVWAEVAARAGDAAFAEEGRAVVERLHAYLDRSRTDADGLIGILQPDETGLDASPAFDRPLGWRSHPNPGFLALQHFNRERGYDYRRVVADGGFHATDVLVNTAWVLGWEGLARLGHPTAAERASRLTRALIGRLFNAKAGFFFTEGPDGEALDVRTWTGLAPLAICGLPPEIGHRLIAEHLLNAEAFWLRYPIPSTAATERSFVPGELRFLWMERYWRGPTWLFSTWFILQGLARFGYEAESAHLVAQTAELIRRAGFREYFNPITGQGMGATSFGVSTLVAECVGLMDGIGRRDEVA
ncbi:MAG: MGH1-like glycoside hydrolase domain-containing protein [Gemmatimonadaceae bacterium]